MNSRGSKGGVKLEEFLKNESKKKEEKKLSKVRVTIGGATDKTVPQLFSLLTETLTALLRCHSVHTEQSQTGTISWRKLNLVWSGRHEFSEKPEKGEWLLWEGRTHFKKDFLQFCNEKVPSIVLFCSGGEIKPFFCWIQWGSHNTEFVFSSLPPSDNPLLLPRNSTIWWLVDEEELYWQKS